MRGSTAPSRTSFCPSASSTMFLFCEQRGAAASPPPAGRRRPTSAAAGRGARPGVCRSRRAARRPAGGAAGAAAAGGRALLEQPLRLVEAQLVAAAVLLGGALDVGDPLAELARVVDRLAGREALLLDLLGGVEEPLGLQLGLLGEAGVLALVPDPDAHLEEADRVGVAEVEVLDARLHERGHDRQLLGQPALLGLLAEPRRELLLRRVVAGVVARDARQVGGRGGGVGRAGRRSGRGGGCAGAGAARKAPESPLPAPGRGGLGLGGHERRRSRPPSARRGAAAAAAAGAAGAGAPGTAAATAAGAAGATGATAPGTAAASALAPPAATSAGGTQSLGISSLKPKWMWSWCAASVK